MDPLIELMRLGQFSSAPSAAQNDMSQSTQQSAQPLPDSSPDNPNNNAYGSSPDSAPSASSSASSTGDPVSGFVNGFLSGFQPSSTARNNLTSLMQQMPQYQPPGFFGKLEAGLIGATRGPQAAQQYLQGPYERNMNAWQNQVKVGQQLASDEAQSNNTGRLIANNQATMQEKYDALAQNKQIADQKAAIAQQRADVYAFRYQNPDWKSAIDKDGQLILYNPKDPTQIHNTGVTTDALTPDMRFQLEKDKEDAAMARTNVQQTGANERNANTVTGANDRANTANQLKGWTFIQGKDGNWMRANQDTGQVIPVTDIPQGAVKPGTAAKPPSGKVVTTEQKTPTNWWEHYILGEGPEKVTKSTVTETEPTTAQQNAQGNNKVPNATDIPLANRTDGMAAMVGGQLMHWSKASGGWVK